MSELLDQYFEETDTKARKKLLKKMEADETISAEEEQICRELFELRFKPVKTRKETLYQDKFMTIWLDMAYHKRSVTKTAKLVNARKELLADLNKLGITAFMEKGPLYKEIMYREIEQLVLVYRACCFKDRGYQRTALGLKKMKLENVENKVRVDIYKTGVEVPECAGLEQEMEAFILAAKKVDEKFYANVPIENDEDDEDDED